MNRHLFADSSEGITVKGLARALEALGAKPGFSPAVSMAADCKRLPETLGERARDRVRAAAKLLLESGLSSFDLGALCCFAGALDELSISEVTATPFPLPLSAPVKGAVYQGKAGMAEPEAVAFLTVAAGFGPAPVMTVSAKAGGAGDVALYLGETRGEVAPLWVLEANLDDLSPEITATLPALALEAGALDAWLSPVVMKKGRPGIIVSALCREEASDAVEEALFVNSSTLGVRRTRVSRREAERSWEKVSTPWGEVRVKIASLGGRVVNAAPEFEDCVRVSKDGGVPVKEVFAEAVSGWRRKKG